MSNFYLKYFHKCGNGNMILETERDSNIYIYIYHILPQWNPFSQQYD